MRFTPTDLPEVLIIDPDVYRDSRGFFLETFSSGKYRDGGIRLTFVQDNHSRSVAGTLRGLHLQLGAPMGKLVRAVVGSIFDVAVDVRRGSPTFGKWVGVTLSADNFRQCYIPPGFAHGFCVETPVAEVEYKCTALYDKSQEIGVAWNSPEIGVAWPVTAPLLSERDLNLPTLTDALPTLPQWPGGR